MMVQTAKIQSLSIKSVYNLTNKWILTNHWLESWTSAL